MSNDVPENNGSYGILGTYVRKGRPFEYNGLRDFTGGWTPEKSGVPKNAGISNDVYENKGRKKLPARMSNDVDENKQLVTLANDVFEKKVLSSSAALVQRAMLSGFVGNGVFAAPRVHIAKRRLEAASARAPLRRLAGRAQFCDSSRSSTKIAEFHPALAATMKRKWEIHEYEGYSQDIIENKGAGTFPSDDTQCGWSTPALSASAGPSKGSSSRSQEILKIEDCSQ